MKSYRDRDGGQRLWLDDRAIEHAASDILRRARLMPAAGDLEVDVEGLIERHLRAELDQYADLPDEVLGLTEFRSGHRPIVLINRDLTGSALDDDNVHPSTRGRWRATLAHEAAHVALHRHLYDVDPAQTTLMQEDAGSNRRFLRCLKRHVGFRTGSSDWREVQANKCMAAFLMPRELFVARARAVAVGQVNATFPLESGTASADLLGAALAEAFGVSKQAASIRLSTCGLLKVAAGPGLPAED